MTDQTAVQRWGERGFRCARSQGWDIADAEDIRQAMMVDYLEQEGKILRFWFAYSHAVSRLGGRWAARQDFSLSLSVGVVPPLDAQLDASAFLARLSKADAHLMRRWLAGDEPTDVRKHDHAARRRAWARSRILVALRESTEAGRSSASPLLSEKERTKKLCGGGAQH
jgi:hypothetical protein